MLDTTLDANNRLTLVSAPAGFGKTTLLGEWLTHLESRSPETRIGWLSLDADDNDLSRLLTHVTAALQGAGLDIDPALLEAQQDTSPSVVLTSLVNDLARAVEAVPARHWVLVLDDVHVISAKDVHEAMSFLLDHLPPRLHLLMASRSDPPLPLSLLRGRGELTEVRAADLRFSTAEAVEFLNRVMGLDLGADDVAALDERTEGWIAGLQLAALSLRNIHEGESVAGFIDAFTGSNRFVIDYLADEVLARQPAEVREFLLRTSVLDELADSLCDAVTAGVDSGRMLEKLERGNLFLVALDDQRSWFRYHHLFADVLDARLHAERPGEAADLHRRASAWYAAHELPIRAVRHAIAARDFGRAAQLMELALADLRRARQDSLLLTWMQSLPESVVRRSPVLSIWSAWSQLMSGDLDTMERWLEAAEDALAAGAQDPEIARSWADTEDLRTAPATLSIYRASLAQARGDVAGTVDHARQALDLAGPEDHLIRGQGGAFLGLAAWADGRVAEALETFDAAVRSLHAAGNLVDTLDATIVLADLWIALGRPSRARELYERGLQQAAGDGEPYPRATADLHVGLAELDRELDDLPRARHHLEAAEVLAQRATITENRHRWYVAMAETRAAAGDHEEVGPLLDRAETLYRRGFYPEIRPIPSVRARLAIAAGDLASASAWSRDRGMSVDDEPDYLREHEHLTLVRLLLAEHREVAALPLLDRLHDAAAATGREGSLVEIRVLQALAHDSRGDEPSALAALKKAFTAPEPESHVRLIVDEGPPMVDLLRRAVIQRVSIPERLERHLKGSAVPEEGASPQQSLADPLSRRELDVLRLLDSELTGPDIARRLFVSINTLRTHTKRIFIKLDVSNRAAAVRRAHQLGLL